MWDRLAGKYGVELIERDGTFIARKDSLETKSEIVGNKVVVSINTKPYSIILQPAEDGVVNTIYLGKLPVMQVRYAIQPQGFADKITCIAKGLALLLTLLILLLHPLLLLVDIAVLLIGPLIVLLNCL